MNQNYLQPGVPPPQGGYYPVDPNTGAAYAPKAYSPTSGQLVPVQYDPNATGYPQELPGHQTQRPTELPAK